MKDWSKLPLVEECIHSLADAKCPPHLKGAMDIVRLKRKDATVRNQRLIHTIAFINSKKCFSDYKKLQLLPIQYGRSSRHC